MDLKNELTLYLNDINSIKKLLNLDSDLSKFSEILNDLENYYEQANSIKSAKSSLFKSSYNGNPINVIEREELRHKLLFKINKLINENIELVEEILYEMITNSCCNKYH
jgi:hypothetical protein